MPRRTDLNGLSAADRITLVNLMLQYINDAVVATHTTITHSDVHIFTGHRTYIEGMESFLSSNGVGQFVPLPKWNPVNEVPVEFRVMKAKQDGTPWVPANPYMPPVQNPNADPGRAMPAQFAAPAVCSVANGNALGNAVNPWHGSVHGAVGGIFGQFAVASAVPLFWCWHAFVDEIYWDYQNLCAVQLVVANFGYTAGGWRVERHPRFLADITGDARADIVGFGNAGVWVSLNNGNGTFQAPQMVVGNFAYNAGGWRVERHPRFLADLTGDGRADIVGFGYAGVWVSLNNGNGTFQAPQMVVGNFGYNAGGWRVDRHPRFLADITGDGHADIVGFGNAGVYAWNF